VLILRRLTQRLVLSEDSELKADDPIDEGRKPTPPLEVKSRFRAFPVRLSAGKEYLIRMLSTDFDAFLRLVDANGKQVAFDDDGGGHRNALIRFVAPATAEYRVIATSYLPAVGHFKIVVSEVQPAENSSTATGN
jgi:hypothetical protein